jgi:N-acetylglucosamine-6-phosphate deacetylase
VVGALLQSDQAVVSLIADGVHVHPSVLRLVYASKGATGVALITDAMPPVGTDTSSFRLQDTEITVRDGACYLSNGTLAGSALSMNRAVQLMRNLAEAPLLECLQMATATPARVLGLEDEIGALKPGARADIAICDRDLNVWKVFVGGELAYEA